MAHAARRGVLLKSGRAVELLAAADAVVFDKTGTLTLGAPAVARVVSLDDGCTPDAILALAAGAELHLRHRLARAIVRQARRHRLTIGEPHGQERSPVGGVRALVADQEVRVGTAQFLEQAGLPLDRSLPTLQGLLAERLQAAEAK